MRVKLPANILRHTFGTCKRIFIRKALTIKYTLFVSAVVFCLANSHAAESGGSDLLKSNKASHDLNPLSILYQQDEGQESNNEAVLNDVTLNVNDVGKSKSCNPREFSKRAHPESNASFYYCNADGTLAKRDCAQGRLFNAKSLECEFPKIGNTASSTKATTVQPPIVVAASLSDQSSPAIDPLEILKSPQFQAPEDICSGGVPLTRLGAPVACNPAASSCPDGYFCTLHSRTGTSYCCQNVVEPIAESALCAGNQVTYFDPRTGLPKSCVIAASSSCPVGFGCNLVGGSFTRCCGRDFGCPANSAGFLNPTSGSHVQCNTADSASCPQGFVCTQSSMFNTGVCCSDTSTSPTDVCGGESPLARPNPCSASSPCPSGFSCRNGRCCPSKGLCPAGNPLGGMTSCSATNPCPNNYQCVTSNGQQYCCPASEHVCGQPRDSGVPCDARVTAVSRFYFDSATGSCRAFQYSQCGGNANNFDTLEQCESFCLDAQCPRGSGLRAGAALAACSPENSPDGGNALPLGSGNAGPFYASAAGTDLAFVTDYTCPSHYSCVRPLFGNNYVCCTSAENVCREAVSSGTACFGAFMTMQRYHYNQERGQCEPFQYYGCNGSGNNFLTKRQCESACQPPLRNACNGVAPLNDEGDYVQRCSETVPCLRGSWCNSRGYCCPHTETACQSPRSIGHTCLSQLSGTYWYFDTATDTCMPFIYSGCGGTTNRFANREACEQMCINKLGECPRGMTPFLTNAGAKQCSLNVAGSCPNGSSCVRSNLGEPICCTSTAQCPAGRLPYVIPGSDSHVACLPDGGNCPQGYQCVQSSNVAGFYMCCSSPSPLARRRLAAAAAAAFTRHMNVPRQSPSSPNGIYNPDGRRAAVATLIAAVAAENRRRAAVSADVDAVPFAAHLRRYAASGGGHKCPAGLYSNGDRCTVNEIESCPHGYVCLGTAGSGPDGASSSRGVCCKASPKCHKRRKPYYIGRKQVLTCGDDEAGCPRGAACTPSSIDGVDICCYLKPSGAELSSIDLMPTAGSVFSLSKTVAKVVPKCRDGALPYFALGSRVPQSCKAARDDECPEEYECDMASDGQHYCCPAWDRCPHNTSPFLVEGSRKPLGCNWMANNCPEGYSCEGSKDRAICCQARPSAAQCPAGRNAYMYAKRPLICPPGKKSCPNGYECVAAARAFARVHLCCSTEDKINIAECVTGYAFFDSATSKNQLCDPTVDSCPHGYRCSRSTVANSHVCCTDQRIVDTRYDGYCPPGQIPYAGVNTNGEPSTCHAVLSPCPTSAPYQCVYAPEKQNSYCCAPVDTTATVRYGGFRNYASASGQPHSRLSGKPPHVSQPAPRSQPQGILTPEQQQQLLQYQQQLLQYQQQQQQLYGAEYGVTIAAMGSSGRRGSTNGCANVDENVAAAPPKGFPESIETGAQMNTYASGQLQQAVDASAIFPPITVVDPSAGNSIFVASCPPWSKPLLNAHTQLGQACSAWNRCPAGFTCYSNFPDGRNAHCCTTVPLDNQVVFRANTQEAAQAAAAASASNWNWGGGSDHSAAVPAPLQQQIQFAEAASLSNLNETVSNTPQPSAVDATALTAAFGVQCPPGTVNIAGTCKRMYFVGQHGCETDAQCRQRTNGTNCHRQYCRCDADRLIHESRCVERCPDGFLNVAGRCHDLTTIVFMDSVDERENGTIGGYCLATVVREDQCRVRNAYCNERTVTCQCRPGYELRMDFGNANDTGSCAEVEGSKVSVEDETHKRRLLDVADASDALNLEDDVAVAEIAQPLPPATFFVIGDDDGEGATTNRSSFPSDVNASSLSAENGLSSSIVPQSTTTMATTITITTYGSVESEEETILKIKEDSNDAEQQQEGQHAVTVKVLTDPSTNTSKTSDTQKNVLN